MLSIPDEEKELRHRLAVSLGDLSERIILEKPPFDELPRHNEVLFWGGKLQKYRGELDEQFREDLYSAAIARSRWWFQKLLMGHALGAFNDLYPKEMETLNNLEQWIREREGLPELITLGPELLRGYKINKRIKFLISDELPGYKLDREYKWTSPEDVTFSRQLENGDKLFLVVDKGHKSRSLSFSVAIEKPDIVFDIANLFGGSQSRYGYDSQETLDSSVCKGLDLYMQLEGHFIEVVEDAMK